MATNTIGYYLVPNATGKTTGAFIRVIPNGTAYFADVVADVMASLATTEQRLKMVWNEAIKVALDYAARGYTVDLGGIRVRPRIPNSMVYEDQPFTPGVDIVIVDAYCDDELTTVFDNVIPYRVSAEDVAGSVKVSNIMDVTTERFATVIGTTQFAVLGNGITLDGADEYVKAYDRKTGEFLAQAVVDRVERGQRAYCHFVATLQDGEVTLEIATHGLASETTLRKFTKQVTAVYVLPTPAITKIKEGVRPDNNVGFGSTSTVLTGVFPGGHKTGDVLRLDSIYDGGVVHATMTLDAFVTSSNETTITLGNGFANESESPDSEWNGHDAKVTLVRAGTEYSHMFAFSAA